MDCQFAKSPSVIAFVVACKIMLPLCASGAEDDIFSGQQSSVGRGTIDLTDISCEKQNCAPPSLSKTGYPNRHDQGHLFRTETPIGTTAGGSRSAMIMQVSAANVLYRNRNDLAMLLTHQTGTGNRMTSVQDPSALGVSAALAQSGQNNDSVGFQHGSYNVATVTQSGNSNVSSYIQAGNGNTLTVRQR